MIYFFVFIVLALIGILNLVKFPKNQLYVKSFGLAAAFIILVLFAGLRYNTGPDYRDYDIFFRDIYPLYDYDRIPFYIWEVLEPGFIILCSFFKTIVHNNQFVFLGLALTSLSLFFYRLKEYSVLPLVTLFCYYVYGYPDNFSILRQVIAINLFFWSIKYIINRNWALYFSTIVLACFFHQSAVILFPLYFVINRHIQVKYIVIAFILAICLFYLGFVPWLFNTLLDSLGGKYANYLSNQMLSQPKLLGTLFIERILILCLLLYKRKIFEAQNKYFNVFLNIYILYIIGYLLLSQVFVLLRFIQYFAFASCILYPLLLFYFKEVYGKYIVYLLLVLILFFRGYTTLILDGKDGGNPNRYLPYKSVIES